MSSNPERENSHLWPEKFSERQYFVLCITWWHLLPIILTNFSVESLARLPSVWYFYALVVCWLFIFNDPKGDANIKHWMEIRLCKISLIIRHPALPQGVYFRLSLLRLISSPYACVRGFYPLTGHVYSIIQLITNKPGDKTETGTNILWSVKLNCHPQALQREH